MSVLVGSSLHVGISEDLFGYFGCLSLDTQGKGLIVIAVLFNVVTLYQSALF